MRSVHFRKEGKDRQEGSVRDDWGEVKSEKTVVWHGFGLTWLE